MTLSPLDKSAYSRHFVLLRYMGAWTINTTDPLLLNVYSTYKTLMTVFAFSAIISLFMDLYMVFGDFHKLTWNLCITALFAGGVIKNKYMLQYGTIVNKLRINLHLDSIARNSPQDERVNDSGLKELRQIQLMFYVPAAIFIPVWLVSRYFSYLWGPRDIPVPLRLPLELNLEDPLQYNSAFVVVAAAGVLGILLVLHTELAMFAILVQISREYKRLIEDMPRINELYEDQKLTIEGFETRTLGDDQPEVNPWLRKVETKKLIKEFSTRQQKLIKYTKNFERSYSSPMLLQLFVFTVLIITSAMQCVLDYGKFSVNLVYQMGYMLILVLDMYLVCLFASRIKDKCLKVGEQAYSSLWYHMDPGVRRELCMIIMRSQRPPKITSGKVMELDLSAYMIIMRNVYSWLALFLQLESTT